MAEIKFCGMTRAEDALEAAKLGAKYVGVIFAGGPRQLTIDGARSVLEALPPTVRRVGVFSATDTQDIATTADTLGLDVVQLHGDPGVHTVMQMRSTWNREVWAVQRVEGAVLPSETHELFDLADAVVLDARVPGQLGGTGVALPWSELRAGLLRYRGRRARLVVAGGLRAENVAEAIGALQPDVVDVSSGVEAEVGVKDHARMRAFRDAVNALQVR